MKKNLAFSLLLLLTSIAFGQIRIIKVVPSTNTITIKNYGTTTIDISNYRLCSLIKYTSNLTTGISINNGNLNLSPGEEVEFVAPGGASNSWQNLKANADLGLYLSSGSFGSASNMVDFVQWGSAGNGRESVANTKGIWTTGDFVSGDEPFTYIGDGTQNGVEFWSGVSTNNNPTDILLSETFIAENNSTDDIIGTLSTTDADGSDNHTYTLIQGTGDINNSSFEISGSNLIAKEEFNFEIQASYSLLIETNDGNEGTFSKSFTITVTNEIEAPTDIILSNQTISENNSLGDLIGIFTAIDEDQDETYSFDFIDGDGSTNNSSFQIVDNKLLANEVFDAEVKSAYEVRIFTNDGNGNTFEKIFSVTITGQNETPTDVSISSNIINENEPSDFVIGSLSTSDPDAQDTHTYSLVSGSGDDNNASFSINGEDLLTNEAFNFEVKSTYSVRIESTDKSGATFSKEFSISIIDQNEAPSDIFLSSSVICFGDEAGYEVGILSSEDEDENDTFTYSLVEGIDDDNNSLFSISNDKLLLNTTVTNDLGPFLLIRIKTQDAEGLSFENKFQIKVDGDPILGLENTRIAVFPNPFVNSITIQLPSTTNDARISLIDLLGRVWIDQSLLPENGHLLIDKIDIPNGFYVLKLTSNDEVLATKRILKQE